MKRFALLALLVLLLSMFSASYAQSAVDPALVAVVTQAADQTRASTSLHVVAQSLIASDGGGQQQRQTEWSLAQTATADGSAWNAAGSTATLMQFGDNQMQTTIQYVVLDGVTYVNLDGAQIGQGGGAGGQAMPQGWFEVTAEVSDTDQAALPMLGATDNIADQALGGLLLPLNAEAITAISLLPDDTIEGQAMTVYQISLDPQAVIDSDASVLLSAGGGLGGRGFGGGQPGQGFAPGDGAPPDGTPSADFTPPAPGDGQAQPPTAGDSPALDPANVTITIAIYIGQTDGLVHRIYSVIGTASSAADGALVTVTITTQTDFSAFNQPIEITAPQIGA